jgi:hypothetical protein
VPVFDPIISSTPLVPLISADSVAPISSTRASPPPIGSSGGDTGVLVISGGRNEFMLNLNSLELIGKSVQPRASQLIHDEF